MPGIERAPRLGVTIPGAADLLASGDIEVLGLLPRSSNYTFLVRVVMGTTDTLAVYKPVRGERPLWDFPPGTLAAREVAAQVVSDAAGWRLVPPTLLRTDAPLGAGSIQLFIDHDPERHYLVLMEERRAELATFAAFDAVINNADRKSGHVLLGTDGRLWAVDHGVSFHTEPKLRTVIWDHAGEPLPDGVTAGLEALQRGFSDGSLRAELRPLLDEAEVDATAERVRSLLERGRFPFPDGDRPYPWPLV